MDHHSFGCDKCRMPSPSVEIPIDVPKEMQTEQGMMLTTYLLMALSIETLQDKNNRLENENTRLREALRAAWKCAHTGLSCSDCRLTAGGCTLQSAMQELGIEVS